MGKGARGERQGQLFGAGGPGGRGIRLYQRSGLERDPEVMTALAQTGRGGVLSFDNNGEATSAIARGLPRLRDALDAAARAVGSGTEARDLQRALASGRIDPFTTGVRVGNETRHVPGFSIPTSWTGGGTPSATNAKKLAILSMAVRAAYPGMRAQWSPGRVLLARR